MCGLIGYASRLPHPHPAGLAAARDLLRHRGPDDEGLWWSTDARVVLAHRRLAIIDLSPAARQPMAFEPGLHAVLNGEIYNYRELKVELQTAGWTFRTSSDTEVLCAAYAHWGTDCLQHLLGMFAFLIYDERRQLLFGARDPAGEKPLYYSATAQACWFASELKALFHEPAFPRRLDYQALDHYLAYGYVSGGRTLLQDVHKVLPGHALTYDLSDAQLRQWSYWQLPEHQPDPAATVDTHASALEALLSAAVRRQLVADVPVGVLLSGGIDSSLIAALAARASSRACKTFTVSFRGAGKYDEAEHARLVARHLGTEHHELVAEPASVELIPLLATQFDEPVADPSIVPAYMISRQIREHAKVALAGNGGDELFGGYHTYQWVLAQQALARTVPAALRRGLSLGAERWLPFGMRGRNYLIGLGHTQADAIARVNLYFDAAARTRLVPALADRSERGGPETRKAALEQGRPLLQQLTRTDFHTYLCDSILIKDDRASMLASLEVRAPFLDRALVEFAFGRLPDALRTTTRARKIVLRRLAARLLPPEFDVRRKQGFSVPVDHWLTGGWEKFFREVLLSADSSLLRRSAVERLLSDRPRGVVHGNRLFNLTMLELWRRTYRIETL
ncbi:MAG: asparagine synthase (glutamine-hydrolyzing) [Longimicrobiales bacterium]